MEYRALKHSIRIGWVVQPFSKKFYNRAESVCAKRLYVILSAQLLEERAERLKHVHFMSQIYC